MQRQGLVGSQLPVPYGNLRSMKVTVEELAQQYTAALKEYLAGGRETALQRAYELGRQAVESGLGLLQISAVHHQALAAIFVLRPRPRVVKAAGEFLAESLAPFEMTYRGFREANAALEASEERYRELFENANDVVFTINLEGKFTSINRAGERIGGYGRDETSPKSFYEVAAPEYHKLLREIAERKLTGERSTTYELEILTKDRRRVPLEVSTRLIYKDGKPVGIHGIARDITERKQAEEAQRRLNEALEEQAKRIAHALHDESGQLLTSVYLALEEVASDLPPHARAPAERIKQLLDEVQEQLRQFSHELRPTILDDWGLAPALEFLCQGVSKRTGISISLDSMVDGRLLPLVETAIYRIVQEALTNVTKHARASQAVIQLRSEPHMVRCLIRDNGIGFDMSSIVGTKGQRGLGLIGIQARLDALGGKLLVNSAPRQGTELVITIPLETPGGASVDSPSSESKSGLTL